MIFLQSDTFLKKKPVTFTKPHAFSSLYNENSAIYFY